MKKNTLITLIGLLFISISAFAADATYKLRLNDNIAVHPGNTVDVNVILENSEQVEGFFLEMLLPDGLTPDGEDYLSLNEDRIFPAENGPSHSIDGGWNASSKTLKVLVNSVEHLGDLLVGYNGTVATIRLKASSTFTGGYISITGKSYVFRDYTFKQFCNGSTKKVESLGNIGSDTYKVTANEVTIKGGLTAEMALSLSTPVEVNGFYAEFLLPEGLNVTKVTKTDRFDGHSLMWNIKNKNGERRLVILIDSGISSIKPLKNKSGNLVNITLSADNNLTDGVKAIKMSEAYATDMNDVNHGIEDCDFTVNTLHAPVITYDLSNLSIVAGKQSTIELSLENEEDINGFAADIKLPAGISVSKVVLNTERCPKHQLTRNYANGTLSMMIDCKDINDPNFIGNSGIIAKITLTADATIAAGTYNIQMEKVAINNGGSSDISLDDKTFPISVVAAGVNDLKVDDFSIKAGKTATVNVELENSDEINGFIATFEIPNGLKVTGVKLLNDRIVDHKITYYTNNLNVLRMVINSEGNVEEGLHSFKGNAGAVVAINLKADEDIAAGTYQIKMNDVILTNAADEDIHVADKDINVTVVAKPEYSVAVSSFGIQSGKSADLEIELINEDDVNGFSATFQLPEHIKPSMNGGNVAAVLTTRAKDTHNLECNYIEETNSIRVLIDSNDGRIANINGNSGTLLVITLVADDGLEDMTSYILMTDAYVCDSDNDEPTIADDQFLVNIATGINEVESVSAENAVIYNIQGQRVNSAAHGIFIMNGKKTVVK